MEQANGERNPAYSVTTGTEVGSDIIVHYQVNEGDNDPGALGGVIAGSRETTGERHEEVVADAGFASMAGYESLEADGQQALIPDRRIEVEQREECAKGAYDRSQFDYREKRDCYICPQGEVLEPGGSSSTSGSMIGMRIGLRAQHVRIGSSARRAATAR